MQVLAPPMPDHQSNRPEGAQAALVGPVYPCGVRPALPSQGVQSQPLPCGTLKHCPSRPRKGFPMYYSGQPSRSAPYYIGLVVHFGTLRGCTISTGLGTKRTMQSPGPSGRGQCSPLRSTCRHQTTEAAPHACSLRAGNHGPWTRWAGWQLATIVQWWNVCFTRRRSPVRSWLVVSLSRPEQRMGGCVHATRRIHAPCIYQLSETNSNTTHCTRVNRQSHTSCGRGLQTLSDSAVSQATRTRMPP